MQVVPLTLPIFVFLKIILSYCFLVSQGIPDNVDDKIKFVAQKLKELAEFSLKLKQ